MGRRSGVDVYDDLYQLVSETIAVNGTLVGSRGYSYDSRGNRLGLTVLKNGATAATSYTYNAADELTAETTNGATISYQYDPDGNRSKKIAPDKTAVYTWDAVGRLVAVDTDNDGNPDFAATYDYRMRRVARQQKNAAGVLEPTKFRYDGGEAFDERDKDGNQKADFARIPGLGGGVAGILNAAKPAKDGKPAREEYYIYNGVGHSVLLVDGANAPVQTNLYEAFGGVEQSWGDSENNRLGNTKEYDAVIGLYNHGFRYFDASIGRYISNDPLGYEGGFNLYVYCTNDPINKFDPHGLSEDEEEESTFWKVILILDAFVEAVNDQREMG